MLVRLPVHICLIWLPACACRCGVAFTLQGSIRWPCLWEHCLIQVLPPYLRLPLFRFSPQGFSSRSIFLPWHVPTSTFDVGGIWFSAAGGSWHVLSGMAVSTLGDVTWLSQMLPALGLSTCAFPPCRKARELLVSANFHTYTC